MNKSVVRSLFEIVVLAVVIVVFLWVVNSRDSKLEQMEKAYEQQVEAYDKLEKERAKELENYKAMLEEERQKREEVEKRIQQKEKEKAEIVRTYEERLEELSVAPPNELVASLVTFTGAEWQYLNNGYFRTTRKGAELTLHIFHEKVKFEDLYEKQLTITMDFRKQIESYEVSEGQWREKEKIWVARYNDAMRLREVSEELFSECKKHKKSAFWRGLGVGVGVVTAVFATASLVK